jgi:transcriptional regulator with XRE-family HTH domain
MKWIFTKLKEARELLAMNQPQTAEASGLTQKEVSLLENGKREFIPNRYIVFLYNKGIDLNSIFDGESERARFRPGYEVEKGLASNPAPNLAPNGPDVNLFKGDLARLQEHENRLKILETKMEELTVGKSEDKSKQK